MLVELHESAVSVRVGRLCHWNSQVFISQCHRADRKSDGEKESKQAEAVFQIQGIHVYY